MTPATPEEPPTPPTHPPVPEFRVTAPRQLRLSELLASLLAEARRRQNGEAPHPPLDPAASAPALPTAATVVSPGDAVVIDAADGLSIGEILDATASAGFGFVVALLALVAIPFVGVSTPFGLAIAFVGAQLLLKRDRPWLPRRLRRRHLSVNALVTISRWLTRATRWMTHLVKPRLAMLCQGPGLGMIGLGLLIQGLGLALPLPIPGSNMVFLVPILVYAIGLLEEDGLVVAIAHVATTAALVVMIALSSAIVAVAVEIGAWFGF